ncbi:MAG TPA: hypothetical protein VJ947_07915, partial [Pseudohaliea sp.]|nr:hypothetical protein [Pseudohaliea sp.]
LGELESGRASVAPAPLPAQNDLFSDPAQHPVLAELAELDVDALSPREALALLYALRERLT